MKIRIALLIFLALCISHSIAYSTSKATIDRRGWFQSVGTAVLCQATLSPMVAHAKSVEKAPTENPLGQLREAQDTLDKLLSNWKRATIDCTYADVPRELLETKNKELLLEKASTFALFDKSVSVESCKTNNRIVRDYLGVTGKGPLVGIDKLLKQGLDFIDPDDLDNYVTELEAFSQALARASSLSYAAGVADLDAVNNFSKDAVDETNENSNLEQAKAAISQAKGNLDQIVKMLYLDPTSAISY